MIDPGMTTDLAGKSFRIIGERNAIVDHIAATLVFNSAQSADADADILLVSLPLLPQTGFAAPDLDAEAVEMTEKGGGRIVILLSAMAQIPMRRHPDYSAAMAAAAARMRGLAMRHGPRVLVNAVGCGLIADHEKTLVSGDPHMLTHLAIGKAGSMEDVSSAVLFLCDPLNSYTTGQILVVDGGWSPGYGRNF
jgi:NAD(P)-dependent dehydrogenase (short-subunit alcohol dehydrogenase family)